MNYVIRDSKKEDSFDIIHVITISWNETYKGIISSNILEEMYNTEDERSKKHINEFDSSNYKELVLEVNGKIVGVIRYGKSLDKELDNCGEIFVLYIIKKYHGYGYGRKLMEEAIKRLKDMGFNKMLIACLKENPTNEFYKHMGGKFYKEGLFERLNMKENIYYYDI